jgi:hypothetical protein
MSFKRPLPTIKVADTKLLQEIEKDPTGGDGPGYLYAFTRKDSPGYIKIGCTVRSPHVRVAEWGRKCFHFVPHLVKYPDFDVKVAYHKRLERLVIHDLQRYRMKYYCNASVSPGGGEGCYAHHGEWFEINTEHAMLVIDRWRKWITQDPYAEEDGCVTLRNEWRKRLQGFIHGRSSESDETRYKRWDKWLVMGQVKQEIKKERIEIREEKEEQKVFFKQEVTTTKLERLGEGGRTLEVKEEVEEETAYVTVNRGRRASTHEHRRSRTALATTRS